MIEAQELYFVCLLFFYLEQPKYFNLPCFHFNVRLLTHTCCKADTGCFIPTEILHVCSLVLIDGAAGGGNAPTARGKIQAGDVELLTVVVLLCNNAHDNDFFLLHFRKLSYGLCV